MFSPSAPALWYSKGMFLSANANANAIFSHLEQMEEMEGTLIT